MRDREQQTKKELPSTGLLCQMPTMAAARPRLAVTGVGCRDPVLVLSLLDARLYMCHVAGASNHNQNANPAFVNH